MDPIVFDIALVVASLGLFGAAYAVARVATRPTRPPAGPAGPELAAEPPAVVSLLANRWRLNEDASESTLLDLAARGYLELRQPGNDPRHTTIHLRQPTEQQPLLPYERRVLDRVHDLAVDGVLPVTALTFRNAQRAQQWNKRLHQEVVHDARARGLSQRRFSAAVVSTLVMVAAISAVGVTVAGARLGLRDEEGPLGGLWFGIVAFAILSGIAGRPMGERDTPAGRQAASRWLGLRGWLRGHEEFANLPPAAVAVWDRYLPYGAALGVTRTASEVLDLGLGDRRLVWSSHGGQWRRVRVRYPKLSSRYGKTAPQLVLRGLLTFGAGFGLVYALGFPTGLGLPDSSDPFEIALDWAAPLLAVVLLARGGYVLLRTIVDLAATRTITGEVLWVQVWRSKSGGKNSKPVPWLDFLAVDDGTADRTTAWGLPHGPGSMAHDRDVVTVQVRPWSRRVVSLTVVEPGRTRTLRDAPAPAEPTRTAAGVALASVFGGGARVSGGGPAGGLPPPAAEQLLSAAEVSQAIGIAVTGPQVVPDAGPVGGAVFVTADGGRPVLMVGVVQGRIGKWLAGRYSGRTAAVPTVGDDAFVNGDRGGVRVGDATVVLTLLGEAQQRRDHLPWLLHQAAQRVPRQRGPA